MLIQSLLYRSGKSIRSVAKKHFIPESTLRSKQRGTRPLATDFGPRTILTNAEELMIVNYISESCKRAHPVTKKNVLDAVLEILEAESNGNVNNESVRCFYNMRNNPTVGDKWWRLFKKRHGDCIVTRSPETLSTARKNLSVKVIKDWFAEAKAYFFDLGCPEVLEDPSRNFNIDESGFSMSPNSGKVLAIKGTKNVFEEVSVKNKSNITVLGKFYKCHLSNQLYFVSDNLIQIQFSLYNYIKIYSICILHIIFWNEIIIFLQQMFVLMAGSQDLALYIQLRGFQN
jgi:hypothetical protein